jgi:hypothetical protein
MGRDRVIGWVVLPALCWALLIGGIHLLISHPVGFVRAMYVAGIPTLGYLMVRDYRAWRPRATMYEWTLAALILVACIDITGGLK